MRKKTIQEDEFNYIRKILDLGVSPQDTAKIVAKNLRPISVCTIHRIAKAQTYDDYKEVQMGYRSKPKEEEVIEPEEVTEPEEIVPEKPEEPPKTIVIGYNIFRDLVEQVIHLNELVAEQTLCMAEIRDMLK